MLAGVPRANNLWHTIEPLCVWELGFAVMFGPLCKAASHGMPLASFGIFRMPMMVAASHYVLRICEILLFVKTSFNASSHEVWPLRRPHRRSNVLFHESRQLGESIVHWITVTFLELFLQKHKLRLMGIVMEMVLTMHPTLVFGK